MSLDITLKNNYCKHCNRSDEVYEDNITHNLGKMAEEAGIYKILWRPEEIGAKKAINIIVSLQIGLETLKTDPKRFKQFNAEDGWGKYENFVSFVEKYLVACKENPEAIIEVSR